MYARKKKNLTSCEYYPLEITPYKVDPFYKSYTMPTSTKKPTKKQHKNNKNEQ